MKWLYTISLNLLDVKYNIIVLIWMCSSENSIYSWLVDECVFFFSFYQLVLTLLFSYFHPQRLRKATSFFFQSKYISYPSEEPLLWFSSASEQRWKIEFRKSKFNEENLKLPQNQARSKPSALLSNWWRLRFNCEHIWTQFSDVR